MVRSAAAVLAFLILPGFLSAQQTSPATHKVVRGDCLWNLADHYYGNPFDWRKIWNANKDKIKDPNLIYPGQVFDIPGRETAEVTGVAVEPAQGGAKAAVERPARTAPGTDMAHRHTIFYQDTSLSEENAAGMEANLVAVSRGQVYAAPWLTRGVQDPGHLGVVAGRSDLPNPSQTLRTYERVTLDLPGASPGVGDVFLLYRVTRTIDKVGRVVSPTGTATVTDVGPNGVTAVITHEYGRILVGDLVGPLPDYGLTRGESASSVSDGPEAMIMGMAGSSVVPGLESIAFLDLGSDDGVAVGDEFELRDWSATGNVVEGRLQVVGVKARMSSARVVNLRGDVFRQGVVVKLAKKMD